MGYGATGGDPDEQISCGLGGISGPKARTACDENFGGYAQACVARMNYYVPFRRAVC